MTPQATAIKRIRGAARKRERADAAKREATEDLRRYIEEAKAAGISISEIAREAGLSRQGVYDLVGRPSS
jgi:hypothetical protein